MELLTPLSCRLEERKRVLEEVNGDGWLGKKKKRPSLLPDTTHSIHFLQLLSFSYFHISVSTIDTMFGWTERKNKQRKGEMGVFLSKRPRGKGRGVAGSYGHGGIGQNCLSLFISRG